MRIYTSCSYLWSETDNKYVLVEEEGYDLSDADPVALCKGASSQQNALAQSQTNFYNTLSADYGKQFANQDALLAALTTSLNPIIAGGPNQYGFSTGETNDLNSSAISGTATSYANAAKALQNQQAAAGGGNQFLPSGVKTQQAAQLASAASNQESSELLGIKQAGYQQGYNEYESAVGQEEAAAGLYNPTGYAGAANSAGNSAANELNIIQQENAAASPWGAIGGILGGVAGSFLGPIGTELGSKVGSAIGGAGSGSGGSGSGGGGGDFGGFF